jgi:hypothetical protein
MIATMAGFQMGVLKPDAPVMAYFSTGVFSISNYNSSLVYVATLTTGSGTATLNTSTGRYTLSGADSRFSVVAKYGAGAPESTADFMERNAYSYSCRTVDGGQSCVNCNCYLDAGCGGCISGPGQCPPGQSQSYGQCGCPGYMCWTYYNGTVCGSCCTDNPDYDVCDVFINESSGGYTNSGTEWYKVS